MSTVEISVVRLRNNSVGPGAEAIASMRLVNVTGLDRHLRGYAIHVRSFGAGEFERRGFIAGDARDDVWRLIEKAAAWAAAEAEGRP